MKIAYFTDTFYPQINGIVTSLINLSKSLSDRGHTIFIIAPKLKKEFEEFSYPGISVKRIKSHKASFYEDFNWTKFMSFSTYKVLKKESIDIIHFQTPVGLGIMAINMSKLLNVPLVGTYHTLISDPRYLQHWKLIRPNKLTQKFTWIYTNQFYNRTDLTTAPSTSTVNELKSNRCKAPVMRSISNGIDPQMFIKGSTEEGCKKYGIEAKSILFVGRISHEKSIEVLIQAFTYAVEKDCELQLIIVGDGPQIEDVRTMVKKSGKEDRIIITGAINHQDLLSSGIYQAASIFATASETETQGITILEAQVNGCVAVGVNERGVTGLIKNGINGIIVDKGDYKAMGEAFISIFSNKEKFESMKAETLIEVKNHFLPKIVDQWEYEYNNLINNFTKRKLLGKVFIPDVLKKRKS